MSAADDDGMVRVRPDYLHRLLLQFRAELERSGRRRWFHGADYDVGFERLADVVESAIGKHDDRLRCKHDGGAVYSWPEPSGAVPVDVREMGDDDRPTGYRVRHLVPAGGWHQGLCGFLFAPEDVARPAGPGYPLCGECVREARIRAPGPGAP